MHVDNISYEKFEARYPGIACEYYDTIRNTMFVVRLDEKDMYIYPQGPNRDQIVCGPTQINMATICEIGDCSLNQTDLQLIRTPNSWLNDNLITFYFEWAQQQQQQQEEDINSTIVILHPSACFMFRLMDLEDLVPDDTQISNPFVRCKTDANVKIIIAPINDSEDAIGAGGSHWSLLVVDKQKLTCIHFDSAGRSNLNSAKETMRCFEKLLNVKLTFVNAECEQQTNGYDCGIYTLMNFHHLYFGETTNTAREFRNRLLQLVEAEAKRWQQQLK